MSEPDEVAALLASKHPDNPYTPSCNDDIDCAAAREDGLFQGFEEGAAAERANRPKIAARLFAAAVAEERDACAAAAEAAQLPNHYQWGHDAMEQFDFGKERAAAAIRARSAAGEARAQLCYWAPGTGCSGGTPDKRLARCTPCIAYDAGVADERERAARIVTCIDQPIRCTVGCTSEMCHLAECVREGSR